MSKISDYWKRISHGDDERAQESFLKKMVSFKSFDKKNLIPLYLIVFGLMVLFSGAFLFPNSFFYTILFSIFITFSLLILHYFIYFRQLKKFLQNLK